MSHKYLTCETFLTYTMKANILYIGRDAKITSIMQRLLNNNNNTWQGFAVCTDQEAITICKENQVDLVLLGNGLSSYDEDLLRRNIKNINANTKIIQHYGGGSGLLYSEIMSNLNA